MKSKAVIADLANEMPRGDRGVAGATPRRSSMLAMVQHGRSDGAGSVVPVVNAIQGGARSAAEELERLRANGLTTLELDPAQVKTTIARDRDDRFQDDEAFAVLVESIRTIGQQSPILVGPQDADGRRELIAGYRRLAACRRLGRKVEAKEWRRTEERDILLAMMTENEVRADISAIERARHYRYALANGVTQEDIASAIGRDQSTISRLIRLLDIPDDVLSGVGDARVIPVKRGVMLARACERDAVLTAVREELGRFSPGLAPAARFDRVMKAAARAERPPRARPPVTDQGRLVDAEGTPLLWVERTAGRLTIRAAATVSGDSVRQLLELAAELFQGARVEQGG